MASKGKIRAVEGYRYPTDNRFDLEATGRGQFGIAGIEPIIGHLKSDGHLGRNYLKGTLGDQQNALLTGVGYNFRLLLK